MRYPINKIQNHKKVLNTTNSTKIYRSFEHTTSIPYTNEIHERESIARKKNFINKSLSSTSPSTKSQIRKNIYHNNTNVKEND